MPGPGPIPNFDVRLQPRMRAVRSIANQGVGIQYTVSSGCARLTGLLYSYVDTSEQFSPQVIAAGPLGRIIACNGRIVIPANGFDITTDMTQFDVLFDSCIIDRWGPEFIDLTNADDMITDQGQPLTILLAPLVFTNPGALPANTTFIATLNAKTRTVVAGNGNILDTLIPAGGRVS